MSNHTMLYGVLVTYRKPTALTFTLERLAAQSRQLDRLLVVDNGSSPEARQIVENQAGRGLHVEYLDSGDNLGPAGGYALGMKILLDGAADEDWIFLFDDDDPPYFDEAIEDAARFGQKMVLTEPATAGVGLSGGRFDTKKGRVLRIGDDQINGPVAVDHITGGGLPAYRVAAVRQVGVFASELFFGFEELEFGLRLTRNGFKLFADGERWAQRKRAKRELGLLPSEEVSEKRAAQPSLRVAEPTWRRYYSLRNLIHILRQMGAHRTAFKVALTRGLLKPLINFPRSPRNASMHLKSNWRAIRDGWQGRLGRTVEPAIVAD